MGVVLNITRQRSYMEIHHKGELVGTIEVSERNRTSQASLKMTSNPEVTRFIIIKDEDESRFNKEQFNI